MNRRGRVRYNYINRYPEIKQFLFAHIDSNALDDMVEREEVEYPIVVCPWLMKIPYKHDKCGLILNPAWADPIRYIFFCFDGPVDTPLILKINGIRCQSLMLPTSNCILYVDTGITNGDDMFNALLSVAINSGSASQDVAKLSVYNQCLSPYRVDTIIVQNLPKAPKAPKLVHLLGFGYRVAYKNGSLKPKHYVDKYVN